MMKKAYSFLLVFLFAFSLSAMIQSKVPAVLASTQQGQTAVSLSVTSYFDSNNIVSATELPSATYGSKFSFASNLATDVNYTFAFWVVNGVIQSSLPVDHEFTLTHKNEFQAVFYPTTQLYVAFMDTNGKILKVQYLNAGGNAVAPSYPTKPGFNATGWTNAFTNVQSNLVTTVTYEQTNVSTYNLSVVNGTGSGQYEYNGVATVSASDAPSGLVFHHWEVDDQTVSYQSTFSFTVLKATTITAYYAESAAADLPRITLSNNTGVRTADSKKSYVGQYYLPSGYTLVETGVIAHATNTALIDIGTAGISRYPATKTTPNTKEFLMSINNASAGTVRGYLIAKNPSNVLVTVYSEGAYNILNGGFETGTLWGWNAKRIWKTETGIDSFIGQDSRAVNNTYFGSNPYNRDGSYNLGIVWSGATWEQSAERMGHLRSSDFILGGSGWISFKLGGGRNSAFAYVSVRKTSNNEEVARFGNKNYNDTAKATTQYGSSISNAEAFMFQYYYDLSAVVDLGTSLYFVITEEASFDWAILSADSFTSYLPLSPTTNVDTLATNIKPVVIGTDTANNEIKNRYFDDDSHWTLDSGWSRSVSNNWMRSNPTGDGNTGVARSSAFIVTTNQYVKFDWAGGLRWDKQIYVSIREVGSNIEVLRFVRRDNLSTKEANNFDNHILDLSSLSSSKLYYIEFADNRTGGWGVSIFDNIRTSNDNNPSGDRAVQILSSVPNFVYVKPASLS